MNDYIKEFTVDDVTYKMIFNLNVLKVIQKKYGTVEHWGSLTDGKESEVDVEALLFGFTEMLNEAIDIENEKLEVPKKLMTEKQVGRLISKIGIEKAIENAHETVINGSPDTPKNG